MRKQGHAWLLVVGALLCSGTAAHAQNSLAANDIEPFMGAWTLDAAKSGTTGPERRVISLGPTWMRVELYRPGDDHPPVLIYNLDGSTNVGPFGSGTVTTQIRRDIDDIVTVAIITVNERPVTVQERLRRTSAAEMVAEVLLRVEHGYQGVLPALHKGARNVAEATKYFQKDPPLD